MLNPEDPSPAPVVTAVLAPAAGPGLVKRAWMLALAAGLVAGAVGWGIGEATLVPEVGFQDKAKKVDIPPTVAGLRNGTVSFGALGAVLGLAMGLAGGLVSRSVPRAVVGSLIGLLLGGAAGAGLTRVILPVYYDHLRENDMVYSLMVHCGIWGAAGAAAGLAYGFGRTGSRGLLSGLIGGGVGAALAAVIYEIAGGLLFPQDLTDRPISATAGTRFIARLLVTLFVAAGVVVTVDSAGKKQVAHEPSA